MQELDYDPIELQRRFPGKFVLRHGNDVLLSADSYEELSRKFEKMTIDWDRVVVDYFERPDRVVIYSPVRIVVD